MTNFIWENLFKNTLKENSIRHKLKSNVLFQDLSLTQLKLLENIVNVRTYRPGEMVFRQGDVGVGMYIVSKGLVNIYVEEIVPESGESKSVHITQLQSGDFFGDLTLVEQNGRRSASAVAHNDCELIGFFKPDLVEITERNPTAGVKILFRLGEVIGTRLKETTTKIGELRKELHLKNIQKQEVE